jgi:hypothetical protein
MLSQWRRWKGISVRFVGIAKVAASKCGYTDSADAPSSLALTYRDVDGLLGRIEGRMYT